MGPLKQVRSPASWATVTQHWCGFCELFVEGGDGTFPFAPDDSVDLRLGCGGGGLWFSLPLSYTFTPSLAYSLSMTLFLTQRAAHTLFVCLIGCSPCRSPYVVVVVCLYQSQCVCVCMTYSFVLFFPWPPLREFVFALTVVNRVGLHSLTTRLEKVIFTGVMFLFIVSVNRLARDGIMCWKHGVWLTVCCMCRPDKHCVTVVFLVLLIFATLFVPELIH